MLGPTSGHHHHGHSKVSYHHNEEIDKIPDVQIHHHHKHKYEFKESDEIDKIPESSSSGGHH